MENKIPKLVHLTYKSENELPEHWRKSLEKWKKYGWEVMFHTDEDNDNLIKNDYPWLLEKYNNFKYFISKIDLVRLCYLHKWGGVYSDLDLYPTEDFYNEIKNEQLCFIVLPNNFFSKSKYTYEFLAGEKGHPFWIELMKEINVYPPWWAFTKHMKIMSTSGPLVFNSVIEKTNYPYKEFGSEWLSCDICHMGNSCKKGKLRKVEGQTWNSWDSMTINFFVCNRKIILIILLILCYILIKKIRK